MVKGLKLAVIKLERTEKFIKQLQRALVNDGVAPEKLRCEERNYNNGNTCCETALLISALL